MDRPAIEQLNALRRSLPPFRQGTTLSSELQAFCAYYQIDFAQHMEGVSHRCGVIESGKFRLATHCWQAEAARANLLLVHGYFDHVGLYNKLIAWALESGFNVLMFDLPGHGLSSGEPAVIDDFGDYALAIHDVLSAASLPELPLWAMAQSTGCAALTEFARRYPWPFVSTVYLAPLLRPANWRVINVAHGLIGGFKESVKRGFSRNSGDQQFLDFIRQDPLQSHRTPLRWLGALKRWLKALPLQDLGVGPILIVQGEADGTVWWRYNMEHYPKLFPGSEIFYLPEAGHQLANETLLIRQHYLARVNDWVSRALSVY